jgi:hypothetical protein
LVAYPGGNPRAFTDKYQGVSFKEYVQRKLKCFDIAHIGLNSRYAETLQ